MSPRRSIPDKKKRGAIPTSLIIGAVVMIAVIAIIVIADLVMKAQNSGSASSGLSAASRTAGDPQARVSFVEYSDFQ